MKQFLRYTLTLVVVLLTTTPAWADDCTYTKSLTGGTYTSKDFNQTICSTTSEAPNVAVRIKYTIKLESTFLGKDLTYTLYAIDSSGQQYQIASDLTVGNGETVTVEKSFNFNKDITSYKIDQTNSKFGGNRKITISNITVTYKYAPSLTTDKTSLKIIDTPVGSSSSVSFSVNYQNSTNNVTLTADESSDVNNSFSISPTSKSITDCSNTTNYTITFSPQSEQTNATATYIISGNGTSLTVTVTATSFATVEPEYTCNIADSYMVDDPAIDLNQLWTSTSPAQKNYNIVSWTPSGNNNTNAVQPAITNNFLSLGQAGTIVLSLSQVETAGYYAGSDTKTILIKKYDTNTITNNLATNYMVDDVVAEADIYTINNNEVPVEIISGNNNVLKFENGQLKAIGAGTTTLSVKQSETYKWVERTATKTITVHKYDITASINPDNAVWNQLITPNPFSASTQHKFSGATSSVTGFTVTQQNNKHIALMDVNSRNIQTYYTNGQVNFLITRPEDYKYNALNQTLTLTVNQSNETCYILEDLTERKWDTNDSEEYTIPSGTPDSLFFQAKRTAILGFSNSTNFYAQYRTENGSWTRAMTINLSNTDTWYNLSCDIPDNAKYIRFITETGATGNKHIQNVRVTRKKSLTPSDSIVTLPVTSIGTPETKTFTLNWSTCSDEILLTNSNPHFRLDTDSIQPTNNEGSTAIKVTCDATVVGTLRDTIVIYDQTQRIFVPVECIVNDKFIANIKGTTAYSKKVDDTWVADFKFDTCQTTLPSAESNAPFYYTISHDLTGNEVLKPGYDENPVISYNPQNNTITAHNAGTAVLTFIQKPTISHYTDTFRCVITVSKHDVELQWKDPVYFNDTISNYFTTTDTISSIEIVSETDTDVAKLTYATSNNSLDLITFNKEDSTTVTVSQKENYKWNGYSIDHTIKPIDPNNHVTFTLTENNRTVFDKGSYILRGWENQSIQFGDDGGGFNYEDKYLIIKFTGIPDSLSFTTTTDRAATTEIGNNIFFYTQEGKTKDNLSQIWSSTNKENNVKIKLNPDTRWLKICYSGNLKGFFHNVTVTELNEFEAVPNVLDFGLQYVDNPETTKSFDFKYANAGYKVHLESTDTMFTVATTYIDTIGGEKYGTVHDIQVTYNPLHVHQTTGEDAMILIWDEAGHRDTVFLHVNTVKSKPSLYWTEDWSAHEPIVLLGQHMPDTVAKATNGYPVKYRSDDESILKIAPDSLSFIAVGIGETYITAHADSDRVYLQPDTIRKLFRVTDKLMQYIVWEDNLTHFCIGDQPDTLHAQAWVMTDAATGEWKYSPEQTAKIQYYSSNPDVVEVQGNLLIIKEEGELLLSATINGDTIYEKTSAQVPVRVRDCSVTCSDADLVISVINTNGTVMMPEDKLEYDPYALWDSEKIVAIDTTAGIPGHLIFAYYGRQAWGTLEGKIRVWESTDGGENWQQVLSDADAVEPENGVTHYSPLIPLSRNATHLKFERFPALDVKLGYHILQHITVLPDKYIESVPNDIHWGNVYVGNSPDTTIAITYSSIRSNLQIASSQPSHLTINKSTIVDDCGAWDTVPLTISLKADISIVGNYHQYVTVTDPIGGMTDTIHVYANIVKNSPTITWNPTDTIRSSAEWETQKTAISSSGDLVLYELTAGNLLEEYAYLNDAGKMILLRGGWITARAYTAETTTSNEVSAYHDFFIVVDPLFQDFDNDGNWLNDNNWNIGRIPWTTDSATIAANKHVLLTTEIITEGLSFESGSAIHITSTGGLTVGAQGIQGAATDGSSIVIDNLKTGAGFLRISPAYQGAMPRATINYQTRSTLDTGANKDATWQYIGAPGNDVQFTVDGITWLYQWSEPQNWINKTGTLTLEPFAGYAITQYGKPTYALSAEAITSDQTITLTKTESGMNGNNLFANSYMAPIDAKNFTPEDFSDYNTGSEDIVKTFYIFNSGSWNEWNKYDTETSKGSNGNDVPGQYCAVPAFSSKYMDGAEITTLPPMQGIYVIANTNGAQIHLNYDKHVWNAGTNPNVSTDMHEPMRTPQRLQAEEQMQQDNFRRIRIQLNSANSGADRLYIIQTDETTPLYDNGYDAPNQTVSGLTNIYTTESFGKMEVSCSNRIDSMYIGFQAGSDMQYTLSFSSLIGDMLYLQDLEQDTIVAMQQDMPYTFSATPLTINDHRFRLLLYPEDYSDTPNTPTDTEQADNIRVWVNNNVLHVIGAPANSTLHIYNISGAHIFTQIISDTPYTYNLSHLSASVYLVRINNYTYKVITK